MKPLLLSLRDMLVKYLTSKKTLTAILTAVAAVLIKDPDTRKYVVETGVGLIVAIGITDHGKAAAETMAASAAAGVPLPALPPPLRPRAVTAELLPVPVPPPVPPPGT